MSTGQYFTAQVGAVLSADIAVPEHERELRFYSRVLTTGARPLWRDDLMNDLGLPIIGLGPRSAAHEELPLQWMPHIQVADVAASARRAAQHGGRVLMQPPEESDPAQWAVLADPNGAAFGIVTVPPAVPPDVTEGPGRIGWLDLTVPDAAATREFYKNVVGWTVQELEMRDGDERYADYMMLNAAGEPAAGICHARGGNADLPPVWMIYVAVGDVGASLERVTEEGGAVIKASKDRDGKYVYAAVRDPVGVAFALMPG